MARQVVGGPGRGAHQRARGAAAAADARSAARDRRCGALTASSSVEQALEDGLRVGAADRARVPRRRGAAARARRSACCDCAGSCSVARALARARAAPTSSASGSRTRPPPDACVRRVVGIARPPTRREACASRTRRRDSPDSPSTRENCALDDAAVRRRARARTRRRRRSPSPRRAPRARRGRAGSCCVCWSSRYCSRCSTLRRNTIRVAQRLDRAAGSSPRAASAASAGSVPRTRSAGSRPPRTICSACTMNSISRMPPVAELDVAARSRAARPARGSAGARRAVPRRRRSRGTCGTRTASRARSSSSCARRSARAP